MGLKATLILTQHGPEGVEVADAVLAVRVRSAAPFGARKTSRSGRDANLIRSGAKNRDPLRLRQSGYFSLYLIPGMILIAFL